MSLAQPMKIRLATISFEMELTIQEVTISLLHCQAEESAPSGFGIDPFTKPNLFLPDRARSLALLQEI